MTWIYSQQWASSFLFKRIIWNFRSTLSTLTIKKANYKQKREVNNCAEIFGTGTRKSWHLSIFQQANWEGIYGILEISKMSKKLKLEEIDGEDVSPGVESESNI